MQDIYLELLCDFSSSMSLAANDGLSDLLPIDDKDRNWRYLCENLGFRSTVTAGLGIAKDNLSWFLHRASYRGFKLPNQSQKEKKRVGSSPGSPDPKYQVPVEPEVHI